jgi:predicted nucleic acid-binding protein
MTLVVLDASAAVEFLLWTPIGSRVADRINDSDTVLHTPHLCSVEIASSLRGLVRGRHLAATDAVRALDDLAALTVTRHAVEIHLPRVWQLRSNLTAYDATYIALAEALDGVLLTVDAKLATPAVRRVVTVEVVR